MTDSLLYGIFVFLLATVALEDIRHRAVWWWLFPLLALLAVGIDYEVLQKEAVVLNLGMILVQLIILGIYLSVKEKKLVNITRQHLGWGDILFWIILCLLFSPLNFILFFLFSLCIAAFVAVAVRTFDRTDRMRTIPLAGIQALILLIVSACMYFNNYSFRSDKWIEKWLITL